MNLSRMRVAIATIAVLTSSSVAVFAQEVSEFNENYSMKVRSVPIAEFRIVGRQDGDSYAGRSLLFASGLGRLAGTAKTSAGVRGWVQGDLRIPYRYHAEVERSNSSRTVVMDYLSGRPVSVEYEPPIAEPVDLVANDLEDSIDPLSMFLIVMEPVKTIQVCGNRFEVFDGRRLVDITFGPVSAQGGQLICQGQFNLRFGFNDDDDDEDDEGDGDTVAFSVSYDANEPDGLYRLDKLEIMSAYGRLSFERIAKRQA